VKGPTSVVKQETQKVTEGNEQVSVSKHIESVNAESAIFTDGEIGGEHVSMLVDTGSAVTLIHSRVWKKLQPKYGCLEKGPRVIAANGLPLNVLGQLLVDIRVASIHTSHRVLVADDISHDCLLGVDFLGANNFTIEVGSSRISSRDNNIPAPLYLKRQPVVCRVSLAETVVVPARHEMVIPAKVFAPDKKTPVNIGPGVVESNLIFKRKPELALARSVVQPQGDRIAVRVVNMSPTPITLYKNSKVANLHPLMEGEDSTECVEAFEVLEPQIVKESNSVSKANSNANLQKLFEQVDLSHLQPEEQADVENLLVEFQDIFSSGPSDIGRTSKIYHKINTGDHPPIRQQARRIPGHRREEVDSMLQTMLEQGVIQTSFSPWAAPIVLVKKKDGTTRFCIDYRKLNDVTKKDAYPLPRIDDTLDALSGAKIFTTLDLASGYWQVEMDPNDREKSAFVTHQGLYEFNVMPFGLCNAPSTFQRLMEYVLAGLQWSTCLIYLDDIIIYGRDFGEHMARLREVFTRLRAAGLKLKPRKCHFLRKEVEYLGHVISEDGVSTNPAKVERIVNWPTPKNVRELRSFLGLASYYRRFIKDFATIAAPLHRLTEKNKPFYWNEPCEEAFLNLKRQLTNPPILAYPRFEVQFILDTDASDAGVGGVLSQFHDQKERVIGYGSRTLTKPERRYSTTRKELLAIVEYVKHFRHYLYGRQFLIRTDHSALKWLKNFKEPVGQLARWMEFLSEFDFVIEHRPGKSHGNADGLSRRPNSLVGNHNGASEGLTSNVECENVVMAVHKGREKSTDESSSWCSVVSETEIKQAQSDDPVLAPIIKSVRVGERPPSSEIQGSSRNTHVMWSNWPRLVLENDILYRRWESEDGTRSKLQLVVPKSLVPVILKSLHDNPTSGHLGVTKTVERVRQRFYWCGLQQDIESWCRTCEACCRRNNPKVKPRASLVTSKIGYPGERVAMDIVGPFPKTDNGNKYILVVSDYFTRWTEAFPIPNQEASTVARVFVNEYVCRYGVPVTLHTDQGRNFESKLLKEMCEILKIDKTRTSPYHPQSDGMVERFNRTLEAMLAKYVNKNHKDWDEHLQLVMLAYRSSVHETTKQTPFFMSFGREARLPVDVMFGGSEVRKTRDQYVDDVRRNMENAYHEVRERTKAVQRRQEDYYNKRVSGEPFKKDDKVWLHQPCTGKTISKKLHQPWSGPYVIIKRIADSVYRVQLLGGRKRKVVHFNRLKPCLISRS
jgi:hypothetical protein